MGLQVILIRSFASLVWEAFRGLGGPSSADMEVAEKAGQSLTIAFDPDGFDVYDLSDISEEETASWTPDPSRVISFRSPEWRAHFQSLFNSIRAGS